MFGEYSGLVLMIFLIFTFSGAMFPLIFIETLAHELGHYFAAKICGVCVYKVSVFGGTPLFSLRIGETLFVIAKDDGRVGGYVDHALIVNQWHRLLVNGAGGASTLLLSALYLVWLKIYLPLPTLINNNLLLGWWTILTLAPAAFSIVSSTASLHTESTDGQKVFAALFRLWEKFSGIKTSDPAVDILFAVPLIALIVCYGPIVAIFWLL